MPRLPANKRIMTINIRESGIGSLKMAMKVRKANEKKKKTNY